MKKFSLFITAFCFIGMSQVQAQTVVAGGNPLNLPCGGGNVDLTALGNSTTPVFGDDFNTGGVAPGWAASASAQFNNPCGQPSPDGSTFLWMGNGTAAPREMTTAAVDVSCGGTVCFDFRMETQGGAAPCEGPDLLSEGVALQCSTNGGATWTDFVYFEPGGNIQVTQTTGGGGTNGASAFTSWANYCFTIPAGCSTPNTQFQLHQYGSSGSSYDHWGIDNFYVYANPCAPYYYDWSHIPGFPDAPNVSTNVTTTTTFTVCYTNGINSVCDNVTVNVASMDITNIATGTEPCLGDDAGTANITINGGVAPFTFTLAGPSPSVNGTGNFTNLAPGNYTVTVNDVGACSATQNFTINPGPACCTVSATSIDALCNGDATGSATANPANGVAPYSYQWNAAAGNQTTQTANNLAAGNYSVTITDANGCQSTVSIAVGEPPLLTASQVATDASCFGICDGQIAVNPPGGGSPGYLFNLNGGAFAAASTFPGLCAGNYNVIVQDNNGCQVAINAINIAQPTDVTLIEASNTPATCGASNGALTVTAGGGTPAYQYDIGGAQQGSPTFNGLASGSYTVTVTDVNGCTETVLVNVPSSAGPVPFVDSQGPVTCAGGLNGTVTIGVGGGTGPYQFSLDGGGNQASNTFAVSSGPHTVTVTDANGCQGSVNFNIGTPTALTFNTVVTDASCNGVCDGTITVNAANATPPYTYSDDNGLTFQPGNVLTGLCAGPINVVVQDANGCLANSAVPVPEPTVLTSGSSFTPPSCFGLSDGTISFTPAGGTPGYMFSVDNGVTFTAPNPQTGISAGNYDIAVQDANGCIFNSTIAVTEPPQFTFNFIANNPSNCGGADGSFIITANNGLAPYIYSIDGNATTQPGGAFFGLFAGLYTLVVTDANGCIDSVFSALSDLQMTTQTDIVNPTSCFNACDGQGIVSVHPSSVAGPYTYNINTGGSQPFGVFNGLCAGDHFITITSDAFGCTGVEQITVIEPDTIAFTASTVDVTCPGGSDGSINFGPVTGGDTGPYTYSIDGGTTFQAGAVFNGLTIGTYNLLAMDNNGCLGGGTVTLTQPPFWTSFVNSNDLLCFNDNSGFIQVVAGGSTGPYTYDLSGTASATGIYINLAANNYTITMTDANGCDTTFDHLITEPAQLMAGYVVNDALCFGSADGNVDVTAIGGTTPYQYSSDNGVILQGSNILAGLSANCYDIYVQDANGCNVSSNECVGEPTMLTMTMFMNPATCGQNNADVTIMGNNGSPGYTYSNDNGATFQGASLFNGLAAANYTMVVEDNNGCQIDSIISLIADPLPMVDNIVSNNPLCFGAADGDITITSSGGVGVHQYSINGGAPQLANTFAGLADGTYDIDVIDQNGCIATVQVILVEPTQLLISGVPTPLLCNNDFTGAIDLNALNGAGAQTGTPPYTYSIDLGATTQGGGTFSFIAAGLYDCQIIDANGCVADVQIDVTEPNVLEFATFTSADPTCFNACDGVITTVPQGGTAPYTYNWSGNIAGPADFVANQGTSPSGLVCPDNYTVNVTDANGCFITDNTTLVDPPALIIPGLTVDSVDCFNGADGSITVTPPVNGVAPYTYSLAGGPFVASNVFAGLVEGNYNVSVMDDNGCLALTNTTVYQPDELIATIPTSGIVCYGANVNIQTFVVGGTVPYSFSWTNTLNANVNIDQVFIESITAPVSYTVSVTDDKGCNVVVGTYDLQPLAPLEVNIPDSLHYICLGESVSVNAVPTGGEMIDYQSYFDYDYVWDTGVAADSLVGLTVSPSTNTTYTITVTDNCGDVVTDAFTVSIDPDPDATLNVLQDGCVPEMLGFSAPDLANLPAGYSFYWDFGNGQTSTSGSDSAYYMNAGVYDVTLTVVSDSGCVDTYTLNGAVTIYDNPTPGFYVNPNSPSILDPTVSIVNTSQGGDTYSYTFDGYGTSTQEEPTITFPISEEATVTICQTVYSIEGCPATICLPVEIHEEIIFYIPNIFTPDGDLFNETFAPVFTSGIDIYEFHLTIFNRWGEIVFESFNKEEGWDGHYGDGGLVKDGTYIWQVEFGEKLSDKRQTHRGHVTVLK